MARVNRTTGIFLVLGMIVLVMSVSAAWYIESGGQPQHTPGAPGDDDALIVCGKGRVDVPSGLSYPSPGVPGRVSAIEVKNFEKVSAGQVFVRIDDTAARLQLQNARATIETA